MTVTVMKDKWYVFSSSEFGLLRYMELSIICLFQTGCHFNSRTRLGWAGAAETFHSSATPEASLRPLVMDFRIDWKRVECPTPTGHPPFVRITPRDMAGR